MDNDLDRTIDMLREAGFEFDLHYNEDNVLIEYCVETRKYINFEFGRKDKKLIRISLVDYS